MLDKEMISQVREIFLHLDSYYVFKAVYNPKHESAGELKEFLEEFVSCSDHLSCEFETTQEDRLEFAVLKDGVATGIVFRCIPGGHEFSSLLLAVLNADGKGKNLPDAAIEERIKGLSGEIALQSYISLSCTNCPDVVQALNIVTLRNPGITHEIINGDNFPKEAESRGVQAVPCVFANGERLHVGRSSLGELLEKLEQNFADPNLKAAKAASGPKEFDVLVLGGGPSGSSAAIYSARKGLKVAVIAETIGGQVRETQGIENLISVPYTTGTKLAGDLRAHMQNYSIELFADRKIEAVQLEGEKKLVKVVGGESFSAPAVIIAMGASWRRLNVEGEQEYIGRGVAFCPHCDGPFYKGKSVAVVGGGNSGIEAAIDLANICKDVTVFEFLDTLKADEVLQAKLKALPNVKVFTSSQTVKVEGNGEKVTGIVIKDRNTEEQRTFPLDGIFVQIGLKANSVLFNGQLDMTPAGEIVIDSSCRTSLPGVYAAGDITEVPFKQIIIAMGEGAKAALSAFFDRMRATQK